MQYTFRCECGASFVKSRPVRQAGRRARCPKCPRMAKRDVVGDHSGVYHNAGNWPMLSEGAGVHPTQQIEAMQHSDKIGVPTEFTADGQAVFRSAAHRKRYCEAVGLYDRNAGHADPLPRRVS